MLLHICCVGGMGRRSLGRDIPQGAFDYVHAHHAEQVVEYARLHLQTGLVECVCSTTQLLGSCLLCLFCHLTGAGKEGHSVVHLRGAEIGGRTLGRQTVVQTTLLAKL